MANGTTVKSLVPVVPPLFERILSLFPEQYFRYCFAYGSGVFDQGKACGPNPMIDLIFSVDDSAGFHGQNMLWNPSHYSGLKRLGNNAIATIQEKIPARVYFNTLIPLKDEGITIKYGVVKNLDLINDLLDWDYLYLAGRLHKPVLELRPPQGELKMALRQNHYSALHAALLILPEWFTERQLYMTIAALSYNGDFRMIVGENKNKVQNIVDNQIEMFRRTYHHIFTSFNNVIEISTDESPDRICIQDISQQTRMYHLFQLPKIPQRLIAQYWRKEHRSSRKDLEDVLKEVSHSLDIGDMLVRALSETVFKSSYTQSLKGIFTAGFRKSLTYSNKKLSKMKQSL